MSKAISNLISTSSKFVGIREAAAFLGVGLTWIYARTRKNEIPHYRAGRYLKFDLNELESWLRKSRKEPSKP